MHTSQACMHAFSRTLMLKTDATETETPHTDALQTYMPQTDAPQTDTQALLFLLPLNLPNARTG